jgi:uncharacterized protein (TIGR02145 family)
MKRVALFSGLIIYCSMIFSQEADKFTDLRDGKEYKTVSIGTQTWFAENLAYKPQNNKFFVWAEYKDSNQEAPYGICYDYYTACRVCPDGWHLPFENEWMSLAKELGKAPVAGGKLKEAGTDHWKSPNTGATNESGFNALPGGSYNSPYSNVRDFKFFKIGEQGWWWTASSSVGVSAVAIVLSYNDTKLRSNDVNEGSGRYVRCVKGDPQYKLK